MTWWRKQTSFLSFFPHPISSILQSLWYLYLLPYFSPISLLTLFICPSYITFLSHFFPPFPIHYNTYVIISLSLSLSFHYLIPSLSFFSRPPIFLLHAVIMLTTVWQITLSTSRSWPSAPGQWLRLPSTGGRF